MSNQNDRSEPTRPLPVAQADCDGNFRATAHLSPVECKTRALLKIPSTKVIPVICIPGIMGSNLCATRDPRKPPNKILNPGEAAWRPPNGKVEGLSEASKWAERSSKVRQMILDGQTLDIDADGALPDSPNSEVKFDNSVLRERGWGEVHEDSYGVLLGALESRLNSVFKTIEGPTAAICHSAASGGMRPRSQPRRNKGYSPRDWLSAATSRPVAGP